MLLGCAARGVALNAVERHRDGCRGRHEHVDEQSEQRGGRLRARVSWHAHVAAPIDGPLVEDGEDEVAKDALEEDHLGQVFEEDALVVAVLDVVEQGEADAHRHLDDADDDRDLHLERVEEGDLIGRVVPDRVDAHRVRRVHRAYGRQRCRVGVCRTPYRRVLRKVPA